MCWTSRFVCQCLRECVCSGVYARASVFTCLCVLLSVLSVPTYVCVCARADGSEVPPHVHLRDHLLGGARHRATLPHGRAPTGLFGAAMRAMDLFVMFPYSTTAHDAATKIARAWRARIRRRKRAAVLFQVCACVRASVRV